MGAAIREARWGPAAVALALVPLNWCFAGWSWLTIGRRIDPDVRFREAMAVVLAGHAVAIWTPARVGEYAGRAFLHGRGKTWAWVAGTGLETFLRFAPPMLVGGIALGFLDPRPRFAWEVARIGAVVMLALIVGTALFPDRIRHLLSRRKERPALAFLSELRKADVLAILGHNTARLLTGSVQMALLAAAFRAPAPFLLLLAASASTLSVKNAIPPVTVGDLGIREGAAVVLFGTLGVAAPFALNAALFVYGFNVLLGAVAGALVWARRDPDRERRDPQ